jgi:hypothetical protein
VIARWATLACLLAALAAGFASPAQASYVIRSPDGGILFATRGEINNVSVAYEPASGQYVIQDTAGIKGPPGRPSLEFHGCTARSSTVVACAWSDFAIHLGDGDDRLTVTSAAAPRMVTVTRHNKALRSYQVEAPLGITASGGPGNDVLIGNAGADSLAGAGEWLLDGVPEDELLDAQGKDTLIGGDGPDLLVAGGGDDRVEGGEGADAMAGGDGNDLVDAGSGDDHIGTPDAGNDRLLGGPGDDLIYPYNGRDIVAAGLGDDRIFSLDPFFTRTGGSTIACGAGNDWFEPEAADVLSGCEQVFEEWPSTLPLCRICTFTIEGRIGSTISLLARLRVALSDEKPWAVIPLGARVRALLRSRGTLRARFVAHTGNRSAYGREWFVLKR